MEPARALFAEDFLPIDLAGFELRDCSVAAIRAAQSCADSETALGKVQPIANGAANAVILHPTHQRLIHASLIDQVFQQAAHRIIGEGGHDGGLQAEAALEAASHVVLTSAFGDFKLAGGPDATIAGGEAQDDFAQGDQGPAISSLWFDRQSHLLTVPEEVDASVISRDSMPTGARRGVSRWTSVRASK